MDKQMIAIPYKEFSPERFIVSSRILLPGTALIIVKGKFHLKQKYNRF
jgi:hypothetical protein